MHRLLQRQIARFLKGTTPMPEGWEGFVAAVSEGYESADADRLTVERSLDLMSQELTERNAALRSELGERQKAETQLEQLLSLLGTTLESTADGILALDKEGRVVRFNQRFSEMWNTPNEILAFWKHEQVIAHVVQQLVDPANFLAKLDYLCHHPEVEHYDLLECLDGRVVERYSLPQPAGVESVGRVFSFRDVTARKRAEDALQREKEEQRVLIRKLEEAHNQLLQSEKMASVGQLAAGVAHEINNPIGFVNSNLGTLRVYLDRLLAVLAAYESAEMHLAPEARAAVATLKGEVELDYLKQDILDLIAESADGIRRVKQIVQDLKDFSHVDRAEWQDFDVHKGLDSTLNIVANEIKYKAEVVKDYGKIPAVECMASQINQVFMNLLVNAAHAIPERGVITVRTGCDGDTVWVAISDTGTGISAENQTRIFDPFFTTKPVGKGTGLGLSVSYSIIEKHHGRIDVDSELGKGTTFKVTLPVRQQHGDQ